MKHIISVIAVALSAVILLAACAGSKDASGKYSLDEKGEAVIDDIDLTHLAASEDNNRVFYEIFVGSFSDSDGDGVGDLRGIINRFDYLNDGDDSSGTSLGVEGIWLTPIFDSPSYHKYDVSDYYKIDPDFGTEDDLKELISLCHERNVKIIIDLVINHTGYLNNWYSEFVSAHRQNDTENKYYDYYCYYTKGDDVLAGRSYTQVSGTDDFVETNFSGSMPELDFDNADVRSDVLDVAKYYLDLGIDGFRFDAAKYIYYGENAKCVEFWDWFIGELKNFKPDIYTVAEVWDGDGITDLYFPAVNCFNFSAAQVSGLIAETAKAGDVNVFTAYVEKYITKVNAMNESAMMIPFITNHDMDRAAGFLTVASGNMAMAANLYLLSGGSPFIYYGEELGMRGSRGGANTDANRRLAMIWGDGDTIADPTGTTYAASSQTDQTAAIQIADGNSLYSRYKTLISVRKANPEIARGDYKALNLNGTKLGGFTAAYNGSTVCVIHNTTAKELTYDLKDAGLDMQSIAAVVGTSASLDGTVLTVGEQTSVILR